MTVGPKLRALAQAQWSPYLPRAIHVAHIYVHFVTLLFAIAIAKAKLLAMEALLSSPRALFSVTPTACWPASARRRRRVASPVKAAAAAAEPAGEEKKPATGGAAAAAGDGQAAAPAPKKILKKKPVYSSNEYALQLCISALSSEQASKPFSFLFVFLFILD